MKVFFIGPRADDPVPRLKVCHGRYLPGQVPFLVFPGIALEVRFAIAGLQRFFDDRLNEQPPVLVLGFPDILSIPRSLCGDDIGSPVGSLSFQNEHVTGFADCDIHNPFAQAFHTFLFDPDVERPDDLSLFVADRFVSGDVPMPHDLGAPDKRFTRQHCGHHFIGFAIGPLGGNVGPHRPGPVGLDNVCADPEHIALGIHALENGASTPNELPHFIHDGGVDSGIAILPQPGFPGLHFRQGHFARTVGELIDDFPFDRFGVEGDCSIVLQDVQSNVEVILQLFLQRFVLRPAHEIDIVGDLRYFISSQNIQFFTDFASKTILLQIDNNS